MSKKKKKKKTETLTLRLIGIKENKRKRKLIKDRKWRKENNGFIKLLYYTFIYIILLENQW